MEKHYEITQWTYVITDFSSFSPRNHFAMTKSNRTLFNSTEGTGNSHGRLYEMGRRELSRVQHARSWQCKLQQQLSNQIPASREDYLLSKFMCCSSKAPALQFSDFSQLGCFTFCSLQFQDGLISTY